MFCHLAIKCSDDLLCIEYVTVQANTSILLKGPHFIQSRSLTMGLKLAIMGNNINRGKGSAIAGNEILQVHGYTIVSTMCQRHDQIVVCI